MFVFFQKRQNFTCVSEFMLSEEGFIIMQRTILRGFLGFFFRKENLITCNFNIL